MAWPFLKRNRPSLSGRGASSFGPHRPAPLRAGAAGQIPATDQGEESGDDPRRAGRRRVSLPRTRKRPAPEHGRMLVNERNWVFTRNLIHGRRVGRKFGAGHMPLHHNNALLPPDRPRGQQVGPARLKAPWPETATESGARLQEPRAFGAKAYNQGGPALRQPTWRDAGSMPADGNL